MRIGLLGGPSWPGAGPVSDDVHATAGSTPVTATTPGVSPDVPGGRHRLGARAWWVAAGVTLVLWALQLSGTVTTFPWMTAVVLLVGLWGLATVAVAALVDTQLERFRRLGRWAAAATLAMTLLAFLSWSYTQVRSAPSYGTDEIAYDQYAATLAVHGHNPYTRSMVPSFTRYQVSPVDFTFQLDGRPVTALSYPALAFEVYLPFLALGWSTQVAIAVNVMAWALGILLLFCLLPRRLRPLAIVVGSFSVYIGYAVGGVTDALYVPLLIGAAVGWNRFGQPGQRRTWVGPLLLGMAMAIKQTPWLILPFVVAGIVLERRAVGGRRAGWAAGGRYLAIALGAFLVPNLPYLVDAPRQWATGVLTPLLGHAVPAGQGAVGLSLFLGLGGGSLSAYTATAAVVLVVLWVVYVATYPYLRGVAFLAPSLALFFSSRSFGSYLVYLVPAAVVAVVTMDHRHDAALPPPWRWWREVAAAGGLAAVAVFAVAVLSPAPLALAVTGVRTTGQLATVAKVTVRVTNRSGAAVHPAFTLDEGGSVTTFWPAVSGPATLAPHRQASYILVAPNFASQPSIAAGFSVDVFTTTPATVSASPPYRPAVWHLALVPAAVGTPLPVGRSLTLRAVVYDQLDRQVDRAGIPVYLGQVIYAEHGLGFSQVVVNGSAPGATPVVARTDAQGVATFVLRGTDVPPAPVYFEANLQGHGNGAPYGYSPILPIRFTHSP